MVLVPNKEALLEAVLDETRADAIRLLDTVLPIFQEERAIRLRLLSFGIIPLIYRVIRALDPSSPSFLEAQHKREVAGVSSWGVKPPEESEITIRPPKGFADLIFIPGEKPRLSVFETHGMGHIGRWDHPITDPFMAAKFRDYVAGLLNDPKGI